jgi:hypothetical protein
MAQPDRGVMQNCMAPVGNSFPGTSRGLAL